MSKVARNRDITVDTFPLVCNIPLTPSPSQLRNQKLPPMKPDSEKYVAAVAAQLANLRTKIPSETDHPTITRQWLYDLSAALLQCQSGLEREVARVKHVAV